jgi:hypothetical protein
MGQLILNGRAKEAEAAVDILFKLEGSATGLKKLSLKGSFEERGDEFFKKVASVISRHEVDKLEVDRTESGEEGEGGERLLSALEGDQWKHIRGLMIAVDGERVGTHAMRALVERRDGPVELDDFIFVSFPPSSETVSSECAALFKSFVASTSIKTLYLWFQMTPSDTESVLNSMDVSRLQEIYLTVDGYSSEQVDGVLDCLTNAHNLQEVKLYSFTPTQEQMKRMQERGVELLQGR